MTKLKFYISSHLVAEFDINHENRLVQSTIYDEMAIGPIIPKSQRTYTGLERQLQKHLQYNETLSAIINHIEIENVFVDYQRNLTITVER